MSKCKCCNQEITTAGCGCDVKLANEGLKDYARLLNLEDEAPEILVPLDLSDAIALIDRQEQQIVKLKATLAENHAWYRNQWAFHEDDRDKQIAALTKERNLYKGGLWASDKDCDDSREQIAVLTAENKKLFEEGTSIMHDQGAENILLKEQIAADRRDTAKYKAFWDHSREIDRINFSRFEWQAILAKDILGPQEPLGEDFQRVLDANRDKLYEDGALRGEDMGG